MSDTEASGHACYEDAHEGTELPSLVKQPNNVSMFMYSAAVWLPHRIHYDERFSVDHDKLPGAIVQGTLVGDWFSQLASVWTGDQRRLKKLSYQIRGFMLPGDVLTCSGTVVKRYMTDGKGYVECSLSLKNQRGEECGSGSAVVNLPLRQ